MLYQHKPTLLLLMVFAYIAWRDTSCYNSTCSEKKRQLFLHLKSMPSCTIIRLDNQATPKSQFSVHGQVLDQVDVISRVYTLSVIITALT